MLLSVYEKDTRKSEIHKNEQGFYVDLYDNDILVRTIYLYDKNIYYAESCAENYVERLGSFYN